MSNGKPRIIKDFEALPVEIQEQIKLVYPFGFSEHLIKFLNKEGNKVSALPFETEDRYYMVRMSVHEARQLVEDDDDFDDDGNLKEGVKEAYEDKYGDDDEFGGDGEDEVTEADDDPHDDDED